MKDRAWVSIEKDSRLPQAIVAHTSIGAHTRADYKFGSTDKHTYERTCKFESTYKHTYECSYKFWSTYKHTYERTYKFGSIYEHIYERSYVRFFAPGPYLSQTR